MIVPRCGSKFPFEINEYKDETLMQTGRERREQKLRNHVVLMMLNRVERLVGIRSAWVDLELPRLGPVFFS
jgi:hypothetical protein